MDAASDRLRFSTFIRPIAVAALVLTMSARLDAAESPERVRAHPRLILDVDAWRALEADVAAGGPAAAGREAILSAADRIAQAPALAYRLQEGRLLEVSRAALERLTTVGLAWRFAHRPADLQTASRDLDAVCAFPDWHPAHFLDTAELCRAVGLAYDWLGEDLDPHLRDTVRTTLREKGLQPGSRELGSGAPRAWWTKSASNWSAVCAGGLTIAALAVIDEEPDPARDILARCRPVLVMAASAYAPEGAYPESLAYWAYATDYLAAASTALATATGGDGGLRASRGLDRTAAYLLHATGPCGAGVAFGDVGVHLPILVAAEKPHLPGVLRWLAPATRADDAALVRSALDRAGAPDSVDQLLWYAVALPARHEVRVDPPPPLGACFHGSGTVAFLRSAWDDQRALWIALKAGSNAANHAHHDLGAIELEALGARWITDLGSDSYSLPGYFDARSDGKRWTYLRTQAAAHSLVTIDLADQRADGTASIGPLIDDADGLRAVADASAAYAAPVASCLRGVALIDKGRAALIQDEVDLSAPATLVWGAITGADIQIDGDSAVLTIGERRMRLRALAPAGARFGVGSLHRDPPEAANAGLQRLEVRVDAPVGRTTIAVLCLPQWPESSTEPTPSLRPLARWSDRP